MLKNYNCNVSLCYYLRMDMVKEATNFNRLFLYEILLVKIMWEKKVFYIIIRNWDSIIEGGKRKNSIYLYIFVIKFNFLICKK